MSLYINNEKYYCNHQGCPYRYCPWYYKGKGVNLNKKDFSNYHQKCEEQRWYHLPENNFQADLCLNYHDI